MFLYLGKSCHSKEKFIRICTSKLAGTCLFGPMSKDWVQEGRHDLAATAPFTAPPLPLSNVIKASTTATYTISFLALICLLSCLILHLDV